MKERPILFTAPMVRAILEGRKTQTRRIVKQWPSADATFAGLLRTSNPNDDGTWSWWKGDPREMDTWEQLDMPVFRSPYGLPGDRLWVKETHAIMSTDPGTVSVAYRERIPAGKTLADTDGGLDVIHVPDGAEWQWATDHIDYEHWRPSIFMKRWASRIALEITDVRVERLQEITGEDAVAEGRSMDPTAACGYFPETWELINGKGSWDANPWVWALTFKQVPA